MLFTVADVDSADTISRSVRSGKQRRFAKARTEGAALLPISFRNPSPNQARTVTASGQNTLRVFPGPKSCRSLTKRFGIIVDSLRCPPMSAIQPWAEIRLTANFVCSD